MGHLEGWGLTNELSGHACTEAMSGAGIASRRKRAEGNAGGVRLERKVRPL